ncbi:calcium-binding protein (plasmid) [Rhizobium leguminosarum]|uniref:calcium-binding protein n=1 Tax=Rhizobium leguminosarum TaxID=384 RepID=UPI001030A7BF|nr:calcium-binding protein [Rhizobium leguminosarum]TBC87276.1 calcium-binding protein [Rhizobium leguminosarum]
MSERIVVTYGYVGGTGSNYHLALHYITPTGHHVLQGGPSIPGMDLSDLINEEIYSDSNTDSPWDRIKITRENLSTDSDIYDGYPAAEVIQGADLSHIWDLMTQAVELIEAVGYEYRPLSQNSNTLVRSLLEAAGLNLPNPESYPIPGAQNTLHNPLNPPANACLAPPWPSASSPMTAPPISPLVLDLDGDGVELTGIEGSNVYFDLDADGFAERTGWITGGDGTLAYDANGNGRIDDITELFGNATTDGFTLLRPFDSNNDGIISASDDRFDELRVWVDSDANGTTDDGELRSLTDLQITSIQVNAQAVNQTIEGNSVSHVASYQREDGSTDEIVDVWYANDQMASHKIIPDGFVFDTEALKLPDLKGWGDVADLQYAMTLDSGLRIAVKDLVLNSTQLDPASFRAAFEAVLAEWTGTAGIEPASRGGYMDAQHLAILEAFYGFQYRQLAGTNAGTFDPGPNAAVELETLYQDAVSCMFTHFASQLAVSNRNFGATIDDLLEMPWLPLGALHYNKETDRVTGALDTVAALASMLAPDGYAGKILMIASLIPYLEGVRLDLYGGDQASYSAAFDAAFAAFGDQRLISISCDIASGTHQLVQGGVGDDVLSAQAGSEAVFIGGGGNDAITGGSGNDTYVYSRGDGHDTIIEVANAGSADQLLLTDINPAAVSLVRNGNDVTIVIAESTPGAGDGGSVLLKDTLDDYFYRGVDKVVFADGTEWSRSDIRVRLLDQAGTSGNDTIAGFNTADTLIGRQGNDALNGGEGNDTFRYSRGDGHDTIIEAANAGSADQLLLTDINPAAVSLVRNGIDVTIVIAESTPGAGDGGSVLLKDTLDDYVYRGIEKVVFADGTSWTRAQMRDMLLTSTAANETFNGFSGNDTFRYSRGDGHDTIIEAANAGSADQLLLTDINPAAVSLVRNGNDVTIVIAESAVGAGDGGSVLLKNNLDDYFNQGVDKVVFADGTVWTRAKIRDLLASNAGTAGNDTISGTNAADILAGRHGNDALNGGNGNDTYVYARGDGHDTITDAANGGTADTLSFTDINPAAVSLVRNGIDVTIVIAESAPGAGDGGSVLLKDTLDDYVYRGIEKVVFADGTSWTRAQLRDMLLTSTAANETLNGFSGNDTFRYSRGDGRDTIIEAANAGSADQLLLTDINPAAVSLVRNGNDVTIVIAESTPGAGDGGSVLLKDTLDDYFYRGVDKVVFADGTEWSRSDIRVRLLDQAGTSGNDTIAGFNTADTLIGRQGNDALNGGEGNDTFRYSRGDGHDTIIEAANAGSADQLLLTDINPAAVSLVRNGIDVTIVIAESTPGAGDGGSVLLKDTLDDYVYRGIEKVVFADGTSWTRAQMRDMLLTSTAANETFNGFSGNDTFRYSRGDGHDTIIEAANAGSADQLLLTDINPAAVSLVRNGNDVTIVIAESAVGAGDGGSVLLKNNLDDYFNQGVDKVVFADGTVWSRADLRSHISYVGGTSGNETITGTTSGDTIHAGSGDDTLVGLAGDDAFVFRSDFGHDTIKDFVAGAGTVDVIDLGSDLFADFASVMAAAAQAGTDTLITHDPNNSILLKNVALTSLHQDDFRFTAAA